MNFKKILNLFLITITTSLWANSEPEIPRNLPYCFHYYEWPNFCLEHLIADPEGCSSWRLDNQQEVLLPEETGFSLYPDCTISRPYLEKILDFSHFIPCISNSTCDYGICTECGKRLLRTLIRTKKKIAEIPTEIPDIYMKVYNIMPYYLYKCECIKDFIDKNDSLYQELVSHWQFCQKNSCFSGYFDKHLNTHFCDFLDHVNYCAENPDCRCHWPETSEFVRNTMDLIIDRFWDELTTMECTEVKSDLNDKEYWKLIFYPNRKLLESVMNGFFYSNLKRSFCLCDLSILSLDDPKAFNNEISKETFEHFCNRLFSEMRPHFLNHYQSCYKKHPHPRIANEIELLITEIECDRPKDQIDSPFKSTSQLYDQLRLMPT